MGYPVDIVPFPYGLERADGFRCWALVWDHMCGRRAIDRANWRGGTIKLCAQHASQHDREGFTVVLPSVGQLRALADAMEAERIVGAVE